jgi:hypothetical protein
MKERMHEQGKACLFSILSSCTANFSGTLTQKELEGLKTDVGAVNTFPLEMLIGVLCRKS